MNSPKYLRKNLLTKENGKQEKNTDRKFIEDADLKGKMLSLTSHHRNTK